MVRTYNVNASWYAFDGATSVVTHYDTDQKSTSEVKCIQVNTILCTKHTRTEGNASVLNLFTSTRNVTTPQLILVTNERWRVRLRINS